MAFDSNYKDPVGLMTEAIASRLGELVDGKVRIGDADFAKQFAQQRQNVRTCHFESVMSDRGEDDDYGTDDDPDVEQWETAYFEIGVTVFDSHAPQLSQQLCGYLTRAIAGFQPYFQAEPIKLNRWGKERFYPKTGESQFVALISCRFEVVNGFIEILTPTSQYPTGKPVEIRRPS